MKRDSLAPLCACCGGHRPRTANPADPEPTAPVAPSDTPNAPVAAVPDANAPKGAQPARGSATQRPDVLEASLRSRRRSTPRPARDEHKAAMSVLRQENDQLRAEILRLQQATPTRRPRPINLAEFFTPEQIKNLGEDDATTDGPGRRERSDEGRSRDGDRRDQAAAHPAAGRLGSRSGAQVQSSKTRSKKPSRTTESLDKDEGWLAWLDEEDAATGMVRQEILTRHCARLDAEGGEDVPGIPRASGCSRPAGAGTPIAPSGSGATGGDPPQLPRGAGTGYPTQAEIKGLLQALSDEEARRCPFVTTRNAQSSKRG